jgi:ABC-type transport system substrate-binding protein
MNRWRVVILLAGLLAATCLAGIKPALTSSPPAQDPYPAPELPQIDPIPDSPSTMQPVEPYPSADGSTGIIGGDSPLVPEAGIDQAFVSEASAAPVASPAGLYFLWGGFIAALLIFITAVVGSVVLFARRVE